MYDSAPEGFSLSFRLQGHSDEINQIAWSPLGNILASTSFDRTVRLWDVKTGQAVGVLNGHSDSIYSVSWSADGKRLASGSEDNTIRLWDVETGLELPTSIKHSSSIFSVAWSPKGRRLASGSDDHNICIWDTITGDLIKILSGHFGAVNTVIWSPDGEQLASGSDDNSIRLWDVEGGQSIWVQETEAHRIFSLAWSPSGTVIASASEDNTVRIWDAKTGQQKRILEGHTDLINCVSFSQDSFFLASKSQDGSVRLWRTDSWETIAILEEPGSYAFSSIAFSPKTLMLATLGEKDTVIRLWNLDLLTLRKATPIISSVYYSNAKVVLVGDTGVGKTSLGLVLTGRPYQPTDSTHGRNVWILDNQEVEVDYDRKEIQEILLWDLAGQQEYRLVHQLYLNDVALALIVFDGRSITDPFAGIYHWSRALQRVQHTPGYVGPAIRKMLVAARTDRGGKGIGRGRIKSLMRELGIDYYFETSAKEGRGISELIAAIKQAIDWNALPKVSSTRLFQNIKTFLLYEKEKRILTTIDDLYIGFMKSDNAPTETEELRAQFETCLGRVESRGLIRKLSFGNIVLLHSELLDTYASSLIIAAKDESDGFGSIAEEHARAGDFYVPEDKRLKQKEQEKLLLIAVIEDLLRYEIAMREQSEDGPYLIFPSQSTRENPALSDPKGKAVIFDFEGPILNTYNALVVRLSHSGLFRKKELWKNAMTYIAKAGGTCGILLHNTGEGKGTLTLFFDEYASEETRFHFEEYVLAQLQRRAIRESISRRRIFICPTCTTPFAEIQVERRRERGYRTINCSVCDTEVSLLTIEERLGSTPIPLVAEMDDAADQKRDHEAAVITLQGKMAVDDYDVFLCHSDEDTSVVKSIGEQLKIRGILPWLDVWEMRPGLPRQRLIEEHIGQIKSAAVFVGQNGAEPWQQMEVEALLREFVKRGCPVIPVLLPGISSEPKIPVFLEGMTWIDFRQIEPDPIDLLVWGITGKKRSKSG